MARPPLPGSEWVHAKIKMTPEQFAAFKAQGAVDRLNDSALVTRVVHAALTKVKPKTVRAYMSLMGKKVSKRPAEAPPAARKVKKSKVKAAKVRKAKVKHAKARKSPPPPPATAPAAE